MTGAGLTSWRMAALAMVGARRLLNAQPGTLHHRACGWREARGGPKVILLQQIGWRATWSAPRSSARPRTIGWT